MLKKEFLTVGSRVKIGEIKDGLIGSMSIPDAPPMTELPLYQATTFLGAGSFSVPAQTGDVLTIVRGPMKKNRFNVVEVHRMGDPKSYYVFWCNLRASCDHV